MREGFRIASLCETALCDDLITSFVSDDLIASFVPDGLVAFAVDRWHTTEAREACGSFTWPESSMKDGRIRSGYLPFRKKVFYGPRQNDHLCVIYTRAFGDGPRNFEPWSSDVELAPPLLTTTPHQREDVSALDRFNVHRCPPTRRVFSGTGIELVTKPATIESRPEYQFVPGTVGQIKSRQYLATE
ncbi:uncharacterized protein TNCV_4256641, partial [Trichonephila clavipes]